MNTKIIVYGTSWCADCLRTRAFLDERHIEYEYRNLETDEKWVDTVVLLNNGMRSIPTIVFPDGSVLVEPTNNVLSKKIDSLKK